MCQIYIQPLSCLIKSRLNLTTQTHTALKTFCIHCESIAIGIFTRVTSEKRHQQKQLGLLRKFCRPAPITSHCNTNSYQFCKYRILSTPYRLTWMMGRSSLFRSARTLLKKVIKFSSYWSANFFSTASLSP